MSFLPQRSVSSSRPTVIGSPDASHITVGNSETGIKVLKPSEPDQTSQENATSSTSSSVSIPSGIASSDSSVAIQ